MTKVLSTRLDDPTENALDSLAEHLGKNPSQIVRDLILDAERARIEAQIRADCEAIMSDPDERAEIEAVQRDMDYLRAW